MLFAVKNICFSGQNSPTLPIYEAILVATMYYIWNQSRINDNMLAAYIQVSSHMLIGHANMSHSSLFRTRLASSSASFSRSSSSKGLSKFHAMAIFTVLAVKLLKSYWNVSEISLSRREKFTGRVKYFTPVKKVTVTVK